MSVFCQLFFFPFFNSENFFKKKSCPRVNVENNVKYAPPPRPSPEEVGGTPGFNSSTPGCMGEKPVASVVSKPCGLQGRRPHGVGDGGGGDSQTKRSFRGSTHKDLGSLCLTPEFLHGGSVDPRVSREFFNLPFHFEF